MAFMKTVVRVGVIGGIAAGGLILIAGPHRVGAVVNQARHTLTEKMDMVIDDPIALRAQLHDLQQAYPSRIAEIEMEIQTLGDQMVNLNHDRKVTSRALEIAQADLVDWTDMLGRAKTARDEAPFRLVSIQHENRSFSYDQAVTRATTIQSSVGLYAKQIEDLDRDLTFLAQQEQRLNDLLVQLMTEQDQLHVQVAQLDAEIEMIERNEKLIDMIEEREYAIAEYSKGSPGVSLDQVTKRLAKIRAEQEARFNAVTGRSGGDVDYREMAAQELALESAARDLNERVINIEPTTSRSTTIITTDGDHETSAGVVSVN